MERARQAAEEGDEIYINWDMYHAIKEVEDQLYTTGTDCLLPLKNRIKAKKPSDCTAVEVLDAYSLKPTHSQTPK